MLKWCAVARKSNFYFFSIFYNTEKYKNREYAPVVNGEYDVKVPKTMV